MLDGGGKVFDLELRRLGAGDLQQLGEDAVDLQGFLFGVFDDGAGGAVGRQIAADDFNDAGNSRQRVADFMRQSGGQLAQRGKVLGARHLRLMQPLNLFPAGF